MIKRTAKYVAAVEAAKAAGIKAKHDTAEGLYSLLDKEGFYWDSKLSKWVEREDVSPENEMDIDLIRVRVTSHVDEIDQRIERIVKALDKAGFKVREVSKQYVNNRPADNGARVYISGDDKE